MRIAVLGTGMVGRAHAARLLELGHNVTIGTRDVKETLLKKEKDDMGNLAFSEWHNGNNLINLATFAEAAKNAEIIFNALKGDVAADILKSLEAELNGKILVDITNPLDFSKGMPPTLFVSNTNSLGETIQKALPQVKVVKSFNTLNAMLQVNPKQLAEGDHTIFMSGNDEEAKLKVKEIAQDYGWSKIIDLGDISTSRGTEMYLPLWLRLWGKLQIPKFNIKVVVDENIN